MSPSAATGLSVTFTFSSRNASLSGDGRKSSTILTRPISPLLYLRVGFFIDRLSFPPVARPKNPDLFISPCETHRHDGSFDPAETIVARLVPAVVEAQRGKPTHSCANCWQTVQWRKGGIHDDIENGISKTGHIRSACAVGGRRADTV